MRTLRTVVELRTAVRAARPPAPSGLVGLVPTMGALHEGHLALIREARLTCDLVVVSLFVNPTQFNAAADLDAYPRDEAADAGMASDAGADFLFAPSIDVVYPPGFSTTVQLSGPLVETLEGAHRGPGHFHGVTTVVTKLFNMVQPDVAFFGEKDAQQVLVIRKLVQDLDLAVRIQTVPTVREADGLARSSRNVHLNGADRAKALALQRRPRRRRCRLRRRGARRRARPLHRDRGDDRPWGPAGVPGPRGPLDPRPAGGDPRRDPRRRRRRRRRDTPDRQHHPRNHPQRETLNNHAAHDAEVQDPPRDGHRL